jgi:hypothetical protein
LQTSGCAASFCTPGNKHRLLLVHLSIIAVSLTGCLRFETAEPAISEAYIAPAMLQLREEIAPRW